MWSFTSGIFLILLHELLNGKKCIMTSIAIILYLNLEYEVEDGQTKKQIWVCFSRYPKLQMSHLMGKPTICIGENKDADQLRGNREADQRLCFRYSDSTIPLLLKSEI